jgi:hypothetical protein
MHNFFFRSVIAILQLEGSTSAIATPQVEGSSFAITILQQSLQLQFYY